MLKNNKGFSLIELMVVVAIIAILSTIAIPSYQTFQAKARQKEGFALMGGYFSAAQASRTEYGFFPGNFVATGFAPNGTINYELVALDSGMALPYGQTQDTGCVNLTMAACTCAGMCANFMEWRVGPMGMAGMTLGWATPATAPMTTATTFDVYVGGVVSTKAANIDEYWIDEEKRVRMVTDGLK